MENLPVELICGIFKQLTEKDRRKLKLVSTRLYGSYCAFVSMSKENPPKYLKKCPLGCNSYPKVFHDCVCVWPERELIGWERY